MHDLNVACPGCGAPGMKAFYQVNNAPTNSVLLLNSQDEALNFPRGTITLAVSPTSGFIANVEFDPALTQYNARYEATQGYSTTFNRFHQKLAQDLIDRFNLRHKTVIEIGCDKGDFITMLCEMGPNTGIGFDPAYVPGRHPSEAVDRLTFIADFYSEKYTDYHADFFACKMTLEHIPDTGDFMRTVRRAIGDREETIVFFQIPNAFYVLDDLAFWDVYYEHCSYFTKGSLAHLFRHTGFTVLDLWTDYDDQYLMIAARPTAVPDPHAPIPLGDDLDGVLTAVERFATAVPQKIVAWQEKIAALRAQGQTITLWGGGSKAVAFLTTLGLGVADIPYVVDINPHKAGTFLAGSGQEIVLPDYLPTNPPDVVIIMNPIYRAEIGRDLQAIGLTPTILTVEDI